MAVERKIGYGLIGLGRIMHAHVDGFRQVPQFAKVVAVCDVNHAIAEQFGREIGAKVYTDYLDMLCDPGVEAVDIALPHNLHYEVASRSLQAGKHVFIEKPFAPTLRECQALIELARSLGLVISVGHHGRFVAAYLEVQRLLQEGVLGSPRLIRTLIYGSELRFLNDPSHWRSRAAGSIGGAILDSGPHSIFLLKWLFGEIASLRAFTEKLVAASEVEDNAVVAGRMKSGALFTTQYTFTAENFFSERLEVYGSKGTLVIDQLRNPPAIFYRGEKDLSGQTLETIPFDPAGWKFKAQVRGVAEFAAALSRNEPPPVDPLDASYVIQVIEKAYASARRSGEPLTI
jgi:predicted dehydrogenase